MHDLLRRVIEVVDNASDVRGETRARIPNALSTVSTEERRSPG
jgi:hypothetical protein